MSFLAKGTTGRPFRFPGSAAQWNSLADMTDAILLARHLLWASTTPAAANEAFNVVNGDVFRWSWMWPRITDWFGIDAEPFDGIVRPLENQMADDAPVWREIAARHALAEADLGRLASPRHTDADLGRPIEVSPTCRRAGAWASPTISRPTTPSSHFSSGCAGTASSREALPRAARVGIHR